MAAGWNRASWARLALVGMLGLDGCLFGSGTGACVSAPVQYSSGQRVYCQEDFDASECSDWSRRQVNTASWTFHDGQTCGDRKLKPGSNPWP